MPSTTSRRKSRSGKLLRSGGIGLAAIAASAGGLAAAAPANARVPQLNSLLREGSSGPAVARVQRALHMGVTGRFNATLKAALVTFQRVEKLQVDGIIGPQTWDVLFNIKPPVITHPSTSVSSPSSTSVSSPSSTTSGAAQQSASTSTGGYTIPSGIVQCESSGSYSAVNSQSGAGGAYQILPSTWQAYGGQGLPQDAPKAEQDRIAGAIYSRQGSSAWSC